MALEETVVVRRRRNSRDGVGGRRRSESVGPVQKTLAMLLTLLTLAGSLVGLTQIAGADPQGIQSDILLDGTTYEGVPVVEEGQTLSLIVQYDDSLTPGSTVAFQLGANVTLTGVPSGNTAMESIATSGNTASITFKDPWPTGISQGVFNLDFTVNSVTETTKEPVTWTVDGDEHSVMVIIRKDGDEFENVKDGSSKKASPTSMSSYVTRATDGTVTLDSDIVDADITYTLTLDSTAARDSFTISDQLPSYLEYDGGSFNATVTTWDSNGLNRRTDPFAFSPTITSDGNGGDSFTSTVDLPGAGARDPEGASILRVTYTAHVAASKVLDLESALQSAHDARDNDPGTFGVPMQNTATFGTETRTATVNVNGTIPGVDPGSAFAKTASWSTKNVVADENGALTPPVEITYTLKADLTKWDERDGDPNFTLDRNVVISDVLPSPASWMTGDVAFITATNVSDSSTMPLTATTCPASLGDFAADGYVGQYCIDGQKLWINVGKDNTVHASIQVKAQLDTVDGLFELDANQTTIESAVPYRWRNKANFTYTDTKTYEATRDVKVVVLPDTSQGVNDSSVFTKTGEARTKRVDPGESVVIDYEFSLSAGQGVDVRTSRIVDYIDQTIFTLGDLSGVQVSGKYDGQNLAQSDFALSIDGDGNLVVELSASGRSVVDGRGPDKAYRVNIALETDPFDADQKETKTITNKATLFGGDDTPLYWSATTLDVTSFGDEAEIRKRVLDGETGEWTASVDAQMDGQGNLLQDVWLYRIEFIPHGSYDNVVIIPVIDRLPDAVEFLGFVDEDDTAGDSPAAGPVDIGGNLEADFDAGSRTVTISQKSGTKLNAANGPYAAYFAVRVTDPSEEIVNRINYTSATIVPRPSVSVGDYVWVDTNADGRQDEGEPGIPGVVLVLTGPDGEPVVDVFGNPVEPTTTDVNGKYTFDDLPALSGDQTYQVCIDREASAKALEGYVPTKAGVGDRAGDSSDWCTTTQPGDLHNDGDRDPTLDFGFVLASDSDTAGVGDGRDDPPGGATQGGKLAWTGTNTMALVALGLVGIWLGWVSLHVGRYRRKEI